MRAISDERSVLGSTPPPLALGARRSNLELGTEVGRYRILRLLGHGGMGAVYAAHDPKLDRQVALKLLYPAHGHEAAERMVREAKALARLDDRHVVQVFDAGEWHGQVFIAMQLIDGEDLAAALARRKPGGPQILAWFCEAGRGLVAAHAAGLVHRDFKPTNVLVDRRGHLAVTDFGLARGLAEDDNDGEHLTKIGALMGTPAYMSPEQHATQPATPASDQFSFCVALWEALFDQHPFIPGDRSVIGGMSPFAIGYHIYENVLVPPPKRGVSRRVLEALTRGLSHDPAARWPSMTELLNQLAPSTKRRTWPIILGVAIAAAAAGGATVWFVARDRDASISACARQAADRMTTVWSTSAAQQLQAQFVRSGRPYAELAARQTRGALDRYASRWQQLARDVCEAERGSSNTSEAVVRRQACLDRRLDRLRMLASMLTTGDVQPAYVDRAQQMVDSIPDLGDCIDTELPSAPPAAITRDVARLDAELAVAEAHAAAGDFMASREESLAVLAEADKLGWAPLQARTHFALGRVSLALALPARDTLVKAAELATAARMDREATRAWIWAQQAAGDEQSREAHAMLASMARASARRAEDHELLALAELKRARGLLRLRDWTEGAAGCKAAFDIAQRLESKSVLDEARDCMVESLVPLGENTQLEQLIADFLATKTQELGDDHPTIADYLRVRANLHLRDGRIVDARKDIEQVLAIRKRTYPAGHHKLAEGLAELADVVEAEGKPGEADALRREALAMLDENRREHLVLLSSLLVNIATREVITGHQEDGLARFERATRLVRKRAGEDSLELAILLINYGQFKAHVNVDAGLGLVGEARDILERRKDRRLPVASIAAAIIAWNAKRYVDVVRIGDETLPLLGPDHDPEQIATMKWLLARALVKAKGDPKRVRTLATDARDVFAKLGPALAADVKAIDALLATLRRRSP